MYIGDILRVIFWLMDVSCYDLLVAAKVPWTISTREFGRYHFIKALYGPLRFGIYSTILRDIDISVSQNKTKKN